MRLVKILMLVLLSGVVLWPASVVWVATANWSGKFNVGLSKRKMPKAQKACRDGYQSLARWVAGVTGALIVFFLVAIVTALRRMDLWNFAYGVPRVITELLVIPLVSTTLTLAMVLSTVLAWRNRYWSALGRVHYTLVTAAGILFVWFLIYWNLLGFRYY